MKKQTPKTLKGFRDFLPAEKKKRDWLLNQITSTAKRFGFQPLETPTLEYASLLTGKYGEEADKLLYTFEDKGGRKVGLRYDQTVPTARVLAQSQDKLPKYFRRYQTQNVFRADKPQRGRYREFRQFDLDIFGSQSLVADAEILAVTYAIFKDIGYKNIKIKLNDREILYSALAPFATDKVSLTSIIQTIDKLDKKNSNQVVAELVIKGLTQAAANAALSRLKACSPTKSLESIMDMSKSLGVADETLVFSPTLARGLDYYTNLIFEISANETGANLGSLGGGGRYDNLVEDLSGLKMPAVGVGLGFDRMLETANELGLVPETDQVKVMVALFGSETLKETLKLADKLRQAGINTEVYPAFDKLSKQLKIAGQKQFDYAVILGEDELKQGKVNLKDLKTFNQKSYSTEKLIKLLLNRQIDLKP